MKMFQKGKKNFFLYESAFSFPRLSKMMRCHESTKRAAVTAEPLHKKQMFETLRPSFIFLRQIWKAISLPPLGITESQ